MLRISCPYCGVRDQVEFRSGGEAAVRRPALPATVSDAQWADYLFYRANPRGPQMERWFHEYGCRQWFLLQRDTLTHAVLGSWPMRAGPAAEAPESEA